MGITQLLIKYYYRHPRPYAIFLPTKKYSRSEKIRGVKKVANIHHKKLDSIYRPLLRNLKNKYGGRTRCFIIGNGPSINRTDLSKLKNEVTFGVNGIFLKFDESDFRPTFYVVEDHLVAEDRADQINQLKGVIKLFPTYLGYCINEAPDTVFFNHQPRISYPTGFDFSTDAELITYTGGTVTFTCMQLAYYLGFREIYLIGVDHTYKIPESVKKENEYSVDILDMRDDDPNHFSPDYFGKGFRWHDPNVEKMEQAYMEAQKVAGGNNIKIYNATKGGCLEVFPRIDYDSLFSNYTAPAITGINKRLINVPVCNINTVKPFSEKIKNKTNAAQHPKVLVVSNTVMSHMSATGSLMINLFTGWPKTKIAHLYTNRGVPDSDVCDNNFKISKDGRNYSEIFKQVESYKPDVIYFKITGEPPILIDFVKSYIDEYRISLVCHIMDDWPERARIREPHIYCQVIKPLCMLMHYAKRNIAICDSMSAAFEERYGIDFDVISNFIHEEDWINTDIQRYENNKEFTIRYCGSLAKDMHMQSLLDIATVIENLSEKVPVKLEIYTHNRWKKNFSGFKTLKKTVIHDFVSRENYTELLRSADLLLIAVNFDHESVSYIRYSMANKLPEYLASGTPVLAYGPEGVETIDYIKKYNLAKLVNVRDDNALSDAVCDLINDFNERKQFSDVARKHVHQYHNAKNVRNKFQKIVSDTYEYKNQQTEINQ